MTVAPSSTATTYALSAGAVGPFATVWPYAEADDVAVYLKVGGALTRLSITADYLLTSTSPLTAGGNVTLTASHDGAQLVLSRESGTGQAFSFGDVLGFSPQSVEDAFDALARQIQELRTVVAAGGFSGIGGGLSGAAIIAALGYVPENVSHRAAANGYAPLDADGKVPAANLPASGGGGAAITGETLFSGLFVAADDAAAATAGVLVGQPYFNGSIVQVRRS